MENQEVYTPIVRGSSAGSEAWVFGGKTLPRSEIVFFCQMLILVIVILASVINLSLGAQSDLWIVLLSTSIGAILPNPNLKRSHDRKEKVIQT
jgi:p-aminobenzoyl-glutamate transporter AbgT